MNFSSVLSGFSADLMLVWAKNGYEQFPNYAGPLNLPNAPVYQADGVTPLSGSQFMAELLAGPSAGNLTFVTATGFLTGVGAGYFFGGNQSVTNVPYGNTAWVQVDVWNTASGASFAQAQSSGLPNSWWQSNIFVVPTGSPFGTPTPPGYLTGLGTSPVYLNAVPEPSSSED